MQKSPVVKFLVTFFLGWLGVHKFMEGKKGLGFLYLFTVGLFGIGWIVDTVRAGIAVFSTSAAISVAENSDHSFRTERFSAAGVYYYLDNMKNLRTKNPAWSYNAKTILSREKAMERIYQYYFINKPVKLIPERTNPHDKNAVMIQIAGEKVGYIPAVEAEHVLDILSNHSVKYISGFIGGGKYKVVSENGTITQAEDEISVAVKIGYV